MRITYIIIGVIIASMIAVGFGNFIAETTNTYGTEYNNSIELYNMINDTYDTAKDLEEKTNKTSVETTGILDIVGNIMNKGVNAVKLTFQSISTTDQMINQGTKDLGLPNQFYKATTTILLIFVILGVVIAAWLRWRV